MASNISALACALACATIVAAADEREAAPLAEPSAPEILEQAGVEGCFVLYDVRRQLTTVVHPEMASQAFLPASTFKIANTIIGLETGVIPDATFRLAWDGKRREPFESWNRDHDLRSAMKYSVVWYYQEIARRIGAERMQRYLELLHYGNGRIDGGVDQFWLRGGGLRITPLEQVEFLKRMLAGELPVSGRSVEIVRSILPSATAEGVTLRTKTGLGEQDGQRLGWMVGYVESPEVTHVFASLVRAPADGDWRDGPVFRARREVALRMLKHLRVVPRTMGQPG